jgi:uncharacterized membrane protein YcaP (DUF421 family)
MDEISNWLFKGWESIARVIVVGSLAYIGLLISVRISGKRTLAKMNAFDLVVTVALGSTLATILLSRQTGLADGLMGFVTLISLQFIVAFLSARWPWFRGLVKSEPTLLFYQGHFLNQAMLQQRVTQGEVLAAIRSEGIHQLDDVEAVVLETDGSFSVVKTAAATGPSSLDKIKTEGLST